MKNISRIILLCVFEDFNINSFQNSLHESFIIFLFFFIIIKQSVTYP